MALTSSFLWLSKGSTLSTRNAVNELPSVDTFDSHKKLLVKAIFHLLLEGDFGKWCTTTRIVDDVLHQALDVPLFLNVVWNTEFCSTLAELGLRGEDQRLGFALTTTTNDTPHFT